MLKNIEFYTTPDGEVMFKAEGEPARVYSIGERDITDMVIAHIRDIHQGCFKRLMDIYSSKFRDNKVYEYRAAHRFIRCNFASYDTLQKDIDHNGQFHYEEVTCPLRGECIDQGVVCMPKIDTTLSEREIEVFRHIAEGKPAAEIAEILCLSIPTINRHRENIKIKIGAHSVSQMTAYWYNNNFK